jgi:NDP-sugar pyrophosphorylase family protein
LTELAGTTAVILAGGLGTRLRQVVPDRPKVLAEVRGRPFVFYLLDQLVDAGVARIVLCTGYMAGQIETCLGSEYRGAALSYSQEEAPLGTAGAIRLALPKIQSGAAFVLNGDSYCKLDFSMLAAFHDSRGAMGTIAVSRVPDAGRFGSVNFDDDGVVLGFREKVHSVGPGWVNAGVYMLRREMIQSIPEARNVSIEKEVFPAWTGRGLYACRCDGALWDIGVPDSLARANSEFGLTRVEDA